MKLVFILGPTAVGKTAYAIQLAQQLGTEIISCDSRQFYKELDIGVARPTQEELAAVRHHFIACRSVTQPYNVFDYEHDVLSLLDQLFQQHDTVVAVGGSGLYVDAICQGMALLPDPAPGLREQLKQQLKEEGIESFQRRLQQLDPEYYQQVDRQNPIRLQRALEVCITSGIPYSQLIRQQNSAPRPFDIEKRIITRPNEVLRERIDRRVDLMLEAGLLDEVRRNLPHRNLNTLNTVGYKELFELAQTYPQTPPAPLLQQQATLIKTHTWQYAKKQLTWLRRYPDAKRVEC